MTNQNYLQLLGFQKYTEVQQQAIPTITKGENLIVSSPTGTGKTHAYLIPIFERVSFSNHQTKVIVIVPTRELAVQIAERTRELSKLLNKDLIITTAFGGVDVKSTSLNCDILIGTPGRIYDLIYKKGVISMTNVDMLILDEADMLFDNTFVKQLDELIGSITHLPQFALFSATLNKPMMSFISKYLDGAQKLTVEDKLFFSKKFNHQVIIAPDDRKFGVLKATMNDINPYLCLVFVNNKKTLEEVYNTLKVDFPKIGKIHGDMTQRERKQMLKRVHNLEFTFVICSDIAARGIDIEGVSHVINYDLPREFVYYIHRIGRSGRSDMQGDVFSIFNEKEWEIAKVKFEQYKIPVQMSAITRGSVVLANVRNKHLSKVDDNTKKEISKAQARKQKKVKPGYKKRRQQEMSAVITNQKQRKFKMENRALRKSRKENNL